MYKIKIYYLIVYVYKSIVKCSKIANNTQCVYKNITH